MAFFANSAYNALVYSKNGCKSLPQELKLDGHPIKANSSLKITFRGNNEQTSVAFISGCRENSRRDNDDRSHTGTLIEI